jgi:hypothetical protein
MEPEELVAGDDVPVDAAPEAEGEVDIPALLQAPTTTSTIVQTYPPLKDYPSLYDTEKGTIVAIVFGVLIVAGIQAMVHRIYAKARSEQEVLTRFAISIVALVIGVYITDLLIAGPDTSLLDDEEHTIILSFVKDICLMVFSYYFGTKSIIPAAPTEE